MGAPRTLALVGDERATVERVRAGDADAFRGIFLAYSEPLCAFVAGYLGSQDAAEEVVQGLFCRVWERRGSWEPAAGVRAYLFGAARNLALNVRRDGRKWSLDATCAPTLVAAGSTDDLVYTSEMARALHAAIAALPPRCREVFRLHRDGGLSYAEVSAVMGISAKTVGVQMGRAMAVLRAALKPYL